MSTLANHYETLNVSNDASADEIKASYLKLYKLFHPDLNPDMQEGMLMISEINKAYEVLKDATAREIYDLQFLAEMKRKSARRETLIEKKELPVEAPPLPITKHQEEDAFLDYKRRQAQVEPKKNYNFLKIAAFCSVAIIGAFLMNQASSNKTGTRLSLSGLQEVIAKAKYVRPLQAPNGSAFPETTSYVSGYEIRNNEGSSSLQVDNLKNDHDVYLKLVSLEENKALAVRHVLIKAKSEFKIENLTTGKYEVQYLDLVAGLVGKSEAFSVSETKNEIGVKASNKSITLQTAVDGVLRVETISIAEFNSLASL